MTVALLECSFAYHRNRPVFTHLSVAFPTGRHVLLGPNGAGKSTLLALLATASRPNAGTLVSPVGIVSKRRRAILQYRKSVAWLPQDVPLFRGLNVREHVAHAGWLKGMSQGSAWTRSLEALESVELESLANRRVVELSGGQRRRLGLAGALVHEANIILLDEPTAGLDLAQRSRYLSLLDRISSEAIVIVSTHDVQDIVLSFDQVHVLDGGQLRFSGSTQGFLSTAENTGDDRERAVEAYSGLVRRED